MPSAPPPADDASALRVANTWAEQLGAARLGTRARLSAFETADGSLARTGAQPPAALPTLAVDLRRRDPEGDCGEMACDFAVTTTLGEGGMGRVYLARQRSLRRDVAIKTVHEKFRLARGADLLEEGIVTGRLEHPNITPIYAVGRDVGGRPVIVMKRIQGRPWSELLLDPEHPWLSRVGVGSTTPLRAHLEILMAVCNALHFAHSRGIVHRDVKPSNVMIGEFGEVYLVDWGIAVDLRAPRTASGLCGTPSYLAPEMALGDGLRVDERTDVFLLGATLHELLTGKPRYDFDSVHDAVLAACKAAPFAYPATVPSELAALANAACAKQPSARPVSALEFRRVLGEFLDHEASRLLAQAAERRLAESELLPDDERSELLVEARFGFEQALRGWPGNEAAQRGFDRVLSLKIERALRLGDLAAARALTRDHPELAERHAQSFVDAEQRMAQRALAEARLSMLDRETNAMTGADQRQRSLVDMVLLSLPLVIVCFIDEWRTRAAQSTGKLTLIAAGLFAAALGAIYYNRAGLFATQYGRRGSLTRLVIIGTLVAHRGVCWLGGEPSLAAVRGDLVLIALGLAITGIHVTSLWFWAVPIAGFGLGALQVFPDYASTVFNLTALALMPLVARGWKAREQAQMRDLAP